MANSLEKENKLLLACARSKLDDKNRSRIVQLTKSDVAWGDLLQLASHHKLLPLLYKHLYAVCPGQIPIEITERLKQFCNFNSLQNLQKIRSLIQIINLFESHDIKVLSVKGPLFTLCYLGDISLRTFCDIDIVVRQQDFSHSVTLLKSIAYKIIPKNIPEQYFFKFAKLRHHGNMVDENGTLVEVHWRCSSHYGAKILDFEALSPFLEICDIQGCNLPTLCPEMLLVYLVIHAQKHCWQRYDYLLCIAEVLNKTTTTMNWQTVFDLATLLKVEKVLSLSLFMACKLLDASIDKKILKKSKYINSLAKITDNHQMNWKTINRLLINRREVGSEKLGIVYPLKLQFINRKFDVIRRYYGQYFLPSESDWVRTPVPYQFNFIYYITKPVSKLFRYIRKYFTRSLRY